MAGQYGTKNLEILVDLGFASGAVLNAAQADGKIDLNDLILAIPILSKIQPAIAALAMAPKEFSELDKEDSDKLMEYGKKKLGGMDESKTKDIVEGALLAGLGLARIMSALKKADPIKPAVQP